MERRPFPRLALHGDRAAVLVNDAARDGQPQAGAFFLRGEERAEQTRQIFRADAAAGVGNGHAQVRTLPEVDDLGGNGDPSAGAVHRLEGVDEQVDDGVVKLTLVAVHTVARGGEFHVEFHGAMLKLVPQQIQRVAQQDVKAQRRDHRGEQGGGRDDIPCVSAAAGGEAVRAQFSVLSKASDN